MKFAVFESERPEIFLGEIEGKSATDAIRSARKARITYAPIVMKMVDHLARQAMEAKAFYQRNRLR